MMEVLSKRKLQDDGTGANGPQRKRAKPDEFAAIRVVIAFQTCMHAWPQSTLLRTVSNASEEAVTLDATYMQVHIVEHTIPNGSRRLRSWQTGLEKYGAQVTQVCKFILL